MEESVQGRRIDNPIRSEIPNRCDLCDRDVLLYQDHDHRTDLCRGHLCHSCNIRLGQFDRPVEEIQRFIAYLTYWERQHATVGAQTYTEYMRELFPEYKKGRKAPRPRRAKVA
jgi:recombination endonuclease VII